MTKWILVFLAAAGSDALWTAYIVATGKGQALTAGVFSALLILGGWVIVVSYQKNKWLVIPAMAGAFVGTYLTILLTQ